MHTKNREYAKWSKSNVDPDAFISKFYSKNLRNVFWNINYDGENLTFKGYLFRLKKATKLVSNAMELSGTWFKHRKALRRASKFFSIIFDYIKYRNLDGACLADILDRIIRVWLRRIELKNIDQILSDSEVTDIEFEENQIRFVNYTDDLKDLQECILEIFMISMEGTKREELLHNARTQGISIPQKNSLDMGIDIFVVVWQEFTKNATNKFLDYPTKIKWGKCNFKCAWYRY